MSDEAGPGWAGVARDGVIYLRFRGTFVREIVDATRRLQLEALRQRPTGCGILFDAGEAPRLPPQEVRDYAAVMAARHPEGIRAQVTILHGVGFFDGAVRNAIAAVFLVAHNPYPRTVVGTPAEAVRYLRKHMRPDPVDEREMLRAFDALPALS